MGVLWPLDVKLRLSCIAPKKLLGVRVRGELNLERGKKNGQNRLSDGSANDEVHNDF